MYGCSTPAASGRVTNAGMSVWNGRFPGATVFGKPRLEREARAAVVQREAGARHHDAGPELVVDAS